MTSFEANYLSEIDKTFSHNRNIIDVHCYDLKIMFVDVITVHVTTFKYNVSYYLAVLVAFPSTASFLFPGRVTPVGITDVAIVCPPGPPKLNTLAALC